MTMLAEVGDLYMSPIHTCHFTGADPIDYLTELQRNSEQVIAAPGDWTPWNYREQLIPAGTVLDSSCAPPGGTVTVVSQHAGR